jgi:hypothetical protein
MRISCSRQPLYYESRTVSGRPSGFSSPQTSKQPHSQGRTNITGSGSVTLSASTVSVSMALLIGGNPTGGAGQELLAGTDNIGGPFARQNVGEYSLDFLKSCTVSHSSANPRPGTAPCRTSPDTHIRSLGLMDNLPTYYRRVKNPAQRSSRYGWQKY